MLKKRRRKRCSIYFLVFHTQLKDPNFLATTEQYSWDTLYSISALFSNVYLHYTEQCDTPNKVYLLMYNSSISEPEQQSSLNMQYGL